MMQGVKLVGPQNRDHKRVTDGILQINYNGTWGTACAAEPWPR